MQGKRIKGIAIKMAALVMEVVIVAASVIMFMSQ